MARAKTEVTYVCADPRCRGQLVWGDFEGMFPPVINCIVCKAGFGLALKDQYEQKKGMFPVRPTPSVHEAPRNGPRSV